MATFYRVGNYSFQWTDVHLTKATTDPFRQEYDVLGSQAITKLQELTKINSEGSTTNKQRKIDVYTLLQENWQNSDVLSTFWTEVHSVPNWVDWEQLERGQKFFYRYGIANILGFALQGFVGENSAASGVVEVLVRTGGFSTRVLPRRLLETFQFILQVTKSLKDIQPGGDAHKSSIRIRLLHSAVRERILSLASTRSDYYDIQKHGIPINTLDSIHSISTFCCNHMWLQLPLMGVFPSKQEIKDYIALWRYIGYLLGTPTEYFSCMSRAKATMESMLLHERKLTPNSLVVGYNFIQSIKDLPPVNISAGFLEAGSRVMNGDELCDDLGLGRPGIVHYANFKGHCWLVRSLAFLQRISPRLDEAIVKHSKQLLRRGIIESKGGLGGESEFEFKYVPSLQRLTGKEKTSRGVLGACFIFRPLETIYFLVFVLGSSSLAGSAFLAVYLACIFLF